jgi:hypothetical protein
VTKLAVVLMCVLGACEHEPMTVVPVDAGIDAFMGTLTIPVGEKCASGLLCAYGRGVCIEDTCRWQCRFDNEPADWWHGCPTDEKANWFTWPEDGRSQCVCLP